jgi:polyisoprenoid-binding protein YceI
MRTLFATALLATTVFTAVHAADFKFTPPDPDYRTAEAGTYVADPHHSSVTFRISHMGLSNFVGRFNNVDARLAFNPQNPTGVNMEGRVKLSNIDTGNPTLDSTLKGAGFFDAEHFPTIKLVAKKLEIVSPDRGRLETDVTMHGITRPVTFDVTFHGHAKNFEGKESMGFSAHTILKRSAFNMGGFIPMVGDDVDIWLESEFNKKG